MTARRLDPEAIGLPTFPPGAAADGDIGLFDLSSHRRAREALARGLAIDDPGFNIFVLGDDRSGRMTAALSYLEDHAKDMPAPSDWVYLNNFQRPHKPNPYRLPAGQGRRLRARMAALIPALREALVKAFESPDFANDMQRLSAGVQGRLEASFEALPTAAQAHSLHLERTPKGLSITVLDAAGQPRAGEELSAEESQAVNAALDELRAPMRAFNIEAAREAAAMAEAAVELRRQTADEALAPLLDDLDREFGSLIALKRWLVELRGDLLEQIDLLLPANEAPPPGHRAEDRYAVNLVADNADTTHQAVVLEPNPTYENLFGYIEYQSINGVLETNFAMIRPGALHRANGGILVLRAENLARQPVVWEALKAALRDELLRVEERYRQGALPMLGAPSPKSIPLDLKVVIVGAPQWYYTFFSVDPEFQVHFKVKADIDPDIEADDANLPTYRGLIAAAAQRLAKCTCEIGAVDALLGYSARWAGTRDRLSAQFELIEDVLSEAGLLAAAEDNCDCLTADHIERAIEERRRRNARLEDRAQEQIDRGTVMIDTTGAVVGQINGLTVQSTGDHSFGRPARVTARTYAGERGVLNIERDIALGGPIQQKGVLVLEGFLKGRFAQQFPLSFSASITFEQTYGGVDGDSASLAELIAVLSSLAEVPIRQDIAITGSVNQLGRAQAIGGANEKIEGFFQTCAQAGLSGSQGVIIPAANEIHLALRPTVAAAIGGGQFHLWSVTTVEEAIELLTGQTPGEAGADSAYPTDSLYGRVMARLSAYDRALTARGGRTLDA